ncbi:MAG: trigger factor [Desulfatiglans sp.]|jgi:trigger factor|nr:trigger factor [Thermodesulfobacteriota bacterium]MEE4353714.1 trigger factor [Desulfatiglans sp.]
MKTSLEDISSVKKKLSVEILSKEVDKKLDKAYRKVRGQAKIPGFRPGKAPLEILQRHFGNQIEEDVSNELVDETFQAALKETELIPLGTPIIEKGAAKGGKNFNYTVVIEVAPHFDLKDYLGVQTVKEMSEVSDEDVQEKLEQIRVSHGKLVPIEEDRPVRKDDYVVIRYEAFEKDTPIDEARAENFLLKVGSNDFHPQFEEALIGLKKDSETEIKVDFEDNYYHSKLAGKKVRFKVHITEIKSMTLPDLDDEFAQTIDTEFKNLAELKEKVRETTVNQENARIDRELKQRLVQQIADTVEFELPPVLVESELSGAIENIKQNFVRAGSSLEKSGLSEEKLRRDFRPASEKRTKEILILAHIVKEEGISIDEDDLQEGFKKLGASTGQDPEVIRKYYESQGLLDSMEQRLLEEKTLNYLVEHANIKEVEKGDLPKDNTDKEKD